MAGYHAAVAMETTDGRHLHPRLMEAARAMHEDRLDVAERLLKPHLKEDPYDVRAIRMLAELAARIGRLKDSEILLRRALEIAPNFNPARSNLAMVLGRLGRAGEALELLEELFRDEPGGLANVSLKAATLGRLGDFDPALALYETVLRRSPNRPRVWMSYGHILKTVGRTEEGIDAYRRAIELNPTLGEAWWSLANLKTVRFEDADISAMEEALNRPGLKDDDRFHLEFAIGKAKHDAHCSDEAFAHYAEANALRRSYHPYRAEELRRTVDRCIEQFTREMLTSPGGCDAPDPIFILGMPRAGSTLIEQILSSHSKVEGTSELPDIPAIARVEGNYPASVIAMTPEARKDAGESYLKRTAVQRRTDRPFFVDKLPNNWLFVPFIHFILPKAKIIDARRHPLGCCLSNFRQHFARGQDFAYDLDDLGRYYSDYVRLMAHVDAMLPGRVHRVIYEEMIDDTEGRIRALLDYCGLDFEPACLSFYETDRAVRTASSEQVRRPIYRDSADEWQRYEAHLGPLKRALGLVLDAYPGTPATFLQH